MMRKLACHAGIAAFASVFSAGVSCLAAEPSHGAAAPKAVAHVSVQGKVVDPDGRPVAKARVVLRVVSSRVRSETGMIDVADIVAEMQADDEGRFAFERAPLDASMSHIIDMLRSGQRGADVVATAPGFGLGWTPLFGLSTGGEAAVSLKKAAALEGVVENNRGEPLVGAVVEVVSIARWDNPNDLFLDEPDSLNLVLSMLRPNAVTDASGHFRIAGLPADHRLSVWVCHPNHPQQSFAAAIGEHAKAEPLAVARRGNVDQIPVQVNPVRLTLPDGPRVAVRVSGGSGQPVGGGRVGLLRNGEWRGRVPADGNLRMAVGSPGDYRLIYVPPEGTTGFSISRNVTLAKADTILPREIEVRIPSGRVIEGRVVGKGSDVGLPGVTVNWAGGKAAALQGPADAVSSQTTTDREGRFRLPVLPGPGRISLRGDAPGFFIVDFRSANGPEREKYSWPIDAAEASELEPLRLEVSRGLIVKGRLLDPQGSPVAGIAVRITTDRSDTAQEATTDADGRFEASGLNPREGCMLSAVGEGLAAWHAVAAAPNHPLDEPRSAEIELTLQPAVTLTGRVLYDGKPLAGVRLMLRRGQQADRGMRMNSLATAVTGADGSYRLSGLKAGDRYGIEVKPPFAAVDPKWHHQMPYVASLPDDASGDVTLEDVNLLKLNQSLSGVVIDPDGKPVAGATVSAQLRDGHTSLSRTDFSAPPPWTKTDDGGRFRLSMLPEAPLMLMAYISPGGGGRIRFPARVDVDLNQQDIRIVLDPSLVEEEE